VEYFGFDITWNETQVGDTVEASCAGAGLTGEYYINSKNLHGECT